MQAMRDGTAQRGAAQRLVKEARESKNIAIRLPIADIERARKLSAKKGLGFQTLIKMLLHESLEREEKRESALDRDTNPAPIRNAWFRSLDGCSRPLYQRVPLSGKRPLLHEEDASHIKSHNVVAALIFHSAFVNS